VVTQTYTESVIARCSSPRRPFSPGMSRLAATLALAMSSRPWRISVAATFAAISLTLGMPACSHTAAASVPVAASAADPFSALIAEVAERSGIPASSIRAVMQAESAGDARAVSPKGAMGLMQIMPATWASLRVRYGLGVDPFDPHDNLLAGAAYLRELRDRYGSPAFIAAYNAGPARYEEHLATGRPLPAETRAYVAFVARRIDRGSTGDAMLVAAAVRSWTEAPLFIARSEGPFAASDASSDSSPTQRSSDSAAGDLTALAPQPGGLFVRTSDQRTQR
jgi:soluble lytic murein transglycosylase-like protein